MIYNSFRSITPWLVRFWVSVEIVLQCEKAQDADSELSI